MDAAQCAGYDGVVGTAPPVAPADPCQMEGGQGPACGQPCYTYTCADPSKIPTPSGYPGGGNAGSAPGDAQTQQQPPTCTGAQQSAAQLASAFENVSRATGRIAFAFGVGTALGAAGEGVSAGIDTPGTLTMGSAATFFATASFLTGATAAMLNSFASGNLVGMQNFDWGQLINFSATAAASRIPGVKAWADTIGDLAEQGFELGRSAEGACQ